MISHKIAKPQKGQDRRRNWRKVLVGCQDLLFLLPTSILASCSSLQNVFFQTFQRKALIDQLCWLPTSDPVKCARQQPCNPMVTIWVGGKSRRLRTKQCVELNKFKNMTFTSLLRRQWRWSISWVKT